MTLALLVLISIMWIPVGMFFLGYGEAKSTGFVSMVVGVLVVIGATLQAAVFTDPFTAGLLFVFGVLYMQTGHALLTGVTDLRTVGNGALLVGIVCAVYAFLYATGGGVKPDRKLPSASTYRCGSSSGRCWQVLVSSSRSLMGIVTANTSFDSSSASKSQSCTLCLP